MLLLQMLMSAMIAATNAGTMRCAKTAKAVMIAIAKMAIIWRQTSGTAKVCHCCLQCYRRWHGMLLQINIKISINAVFDVVIIILITLQMI